MTVAYDSKNEVASAANPTAVTLTPVGTLRGVVAFLTHQGATDIISGVTAGGVAMERTRSEADTIGVPGRTYAYFLGASVPTGAISISAARTEATTSVHLVVVGLTAAGDCIVVTSDGIDANQADPQVTLGYGGVSCLALCALYTGHAAPATPVDLGTMTRVHDHDFGDDSSVVSRQTTAGTADYTIGYTCATTSTALVAVAIGEGTDPGTPPIVPSSGASSAPRSPSFIRQALQSARDLKGLTQVLTRELPRLAQSVVCYEPAVVLNYGTTVRPSGNLSRVQLVPVTDTVAWAMANPSSPREGVEVTYDIWNEAGAAMGTITWGDEYELTETFVTPADTKHRLISFIRMPDSVWRESRRTANDSD